MARTKKSEIEEAVATEATTTTTTTATKKAAKKKTEDSGSRVAYFLKVRVTFTTPLLATNPNDQEIYTQFIAKEASDESRKEEIERLGVDEVIERGMTVFLRDKEDPSIPLLKDYTWLGYLKSRAKALAKIPGSSLKGASAYIKEVNDLIKVTPRFQPLILPEGGAIETLERPLRAETAQGDRVALAKSETVPEGTTCEVTFRAERIEGMNYIIDCLNYGKEHGTGQWRNAGFGRFTYEVLDKWAEAIETEHVTASDFPMR
jgi:hypothetical protein